MPFCALCIYNAHTIQTRFLPDPLARYRAWSATEIRSSADRPFSGKDVTPMEMVILNLPDVSVSTTIASTSFLIRSASTAASASGVGYAVGKVQTGVGAGDGMGIRIGIGDILAGGQAGQALELFSKVLYIIVLAKHLPRPRNIEQKLSASPEEKTAMLVDACWQTKHKS